MIIIKGKVRENKGRGKELGFPTANVSLNQNVEEGIYVSQITIGSELHNSLTFIGAAKTFNENQVQAETYILDFDKDIYGKEVEVQLLKKIRENKKFSSADDLVEQMKKDEEEAREFFKMSS